MNVGAWTAVGVGIGAGVFSATGEVWWIAIGGGIGVAIGTALQRRRHQ